MGADQIKGVLKCMQDRVVGIRKADFSSYIKARPIFAEVLLNTVGVCACKWIALSGGEDLRHIGRSELAVARAAISCMASNLVQGHHVPARFIA